MTGKDRRLCIGIILGAHGTKGAVRIKCLADAGLMAYGQLENETGKQISPVLIGKAKGMLVARMDGVKDCNGAEALKGTRLYVQREALPPAGEDEFYYGDLVGLRVLTMDGADFGRVTGIFDFGAGDIIEIVGEQGSMLFPFTKKIIPEIDLASGKLVIDPPLEGEMIDCA